MAAAAAAAADHILKNGEVSAMIKQGFLSSPPFSSSSRLSPRASPPSTSFRNHPSPPPPTTTLFDMIGKDHHHHHQQQQNAKPLAPSRDQKWIRLQDRVSSIAGEYPNWGAGDVELTVSSGDGFRVSMIVHRRVLAYQSRFFAEKLVGAREGASHVVEICECDDAEVYVEAVALMYCEDHRRKLAGEGVGKVLGLLKVSAAIMFDAGVASCLEYLEAVPWSEDEEERVVSVLSQLPLCNPVSEALQRVSVEPPTSTRTDGIFLRLLAGVLQAKDEKARREMKSLISGLLRDDTSTRADVSKETLYHLCHRCLNSLLLCLTETAGSDESSRDRAVLMAEIAREADNVQWMVDILISKKMGGEFVRLWADQTELARLHSKIPCVYRFEISRITAQLCVAVGRGQILVSKDARFSLLRTWLEALYEDFGWMKRACRSLDKKSVEDGLGQTILTLPMAQQQAILLNWFDRFLNKGDDCPNIQRAFEIWWRRAFVRHYVGDQEESRLQIAVCDYQT